MSELKSTDTFSVGATTGSNAAPYSFVAAHFLLDQNGNPITDPVVGGSQSYNIYLSDGTVLDGKDANLNN